LSELPVRTLAGSYSPKAVQPKDLPTDEEIVTQYKRLQSTSMRWLYGVMAAYGLRPHEPFHLDLKDFPKIRVGDHTKTGYRRRFVLPLYPEWAQEWQLWDRSLPDFAALKESSGGKDAAPEDYDNTHLTNRVSNRFRRRNIGFSPLYLRHAYAARNFRCGLSTAYGAKQMGHSVKVHETIYQAWVSEGIYEEIYDKQMKGDRPKAPL
jgi:integrase